MSRIPTSTIISKRLCLVCARDGVEKPVQEHECDHEHFHLTLRCLEGQWLAIYRRRWCRCLYGSWVSIADITNSDLWRMACAVGGFRKSFGQRHLDWVPLYRCEEQDHWYGTPREAVLRAYMDQAWVSVDKTA